MPYVHELSPLWLLCAGVVCTTEPKPGVLGQVASSPNLEQLHAQLGRGWFLPFSCLVGDAGSWMALQITELGRRPGCVGCPRAGSLASVSRLMLLCCPYWLVGS